MPSLVQIVVYALRSTSAQSKEVVNPSLCTQYSSINKLMTLKKHQRSEVTTLKLSMARLMGGSQELTLLFSLMKPIAAKAREQSLQLGILRCKI